MVKDWCFSNREEQNKTVDEELLMTGVSVSEESQKVLNGGVSASGTVVFQHHEKKKKMMKGC
jgi:hypothetical protein